MGRVGEPGAVGGEFLRIGLLANDGVENVALQGLGDEIVVEGVVEVVGLVGEGGGADGEVALSGEGEELGCIGLWKGRGGGQLGGSLED